MSGLNYKKLSSTLSNICNTTQLDDATKCHYAFKNFWGEPRRSKTNNQILNHSTGSNSLILDLTLSKISPSFYMFAVKSYS